MVLLFFLMSFVNTMLDRYTMLICGILSMLQCSGASVTVHCMVTIWKKTFKVFFRNSWLCWTANTRSLTPLHSTIPPPQQCRLVLCNWSLLHQKVIILFWTDWELTGKGISVSITITQLYSNIPRRLFCSALRFMAYSFAVWAIPWWSQPWGVEQLWSLFWQVCSGSRSCTSVFRTLILGMLIGGIHPALILKMSILVPRSATSLHSATFPIVLSSCSMIRLQHLSHQSLTFAEG